MYRQARLDAANARWQARRDEKERLRLLRGWQTIDSAPENEVIILYDPVIFWPVVAEWDGKDWKCLHYDGAVRPTHWRPILPIPL